MGQVPFLLDEMGLDEMGLDEMAINHLDCCHLESDTFAREVLPLIFLCTLLSPLPLVAQGLCSSGFN